MKRITNILSYLCLLLLLIVVACSDLEEIVVNMQGEEEVELTIQTNIPSLGGSTRTAPIENITSITALAFDSDYELVKVVKATLDRDVTNGENNSTVGTMTIKVPVRTRRIHFISQNNDDFSRITDADYGRTDIDLLKTLASDELHYWQVVNFTNKTNLQSFNNGAELELIRNKARVFLTLPQDASMTGHIVGFLNYNTTGTIAASKNEEFGYVATGDNHEMPSTFLVASDSDPDANLGTEHYLFEEKNTKGADGFGDAADLVYVVCWIKKGNEDGKYYKIAFKSGESYYHIIRNLKYEIKISKDLDTTRGYANFADAVAKAPINDAGAKVQIHMNFNPDPLSILLDNDPETASSATTMITNFEGIQTLQIGYPQEFFGEGGVIINGYDTQPDVIEAKTPAGTDIWIVEYNVEGKTELELSVTLKDGIENAVNDIQIQFLGEGSEVFVNDILHANALQRGDLTITTSATQIPKVAGSQFTASVPVQSYAQDVGEYRLFIDDANDAFTVTLPDGVRTLADGSYEVTNLAGSQAVFTFTLIEDGEAGDEHEISFDLYTDFHHFIGTTTVTLVEEEIVREIVATPSDNSLNYAGSSVEDLWVEVTIPKEVNKLTFASDHFKIMATGGGLTATEGGYTVAHEEGATETTTSVRIRLNDGVSGTAQFTFGGESDKQNVTVQSASGDITLNNNGDANVRWQGNVPLDSDDYTTIVPLKYEWFESIAAGSKLNLEFKVTGGETSWLEVFEIQGETEDDWTNHNFEELTDDNRYVATGNGNYTLSLTITDEILETIKVNFWSDFLGETKIAMAIRGTGITLTKVSVVPPVVVPDQDVYEIWVNNNSEWIGNSDADVAFFGYTGQNFNTGTSNNLRATFYDTNADNHIQQAMVMGSDDSFTFTIPAGSNRWLTLLVANDGDDSDTPSIQLSNGSDWTTVTSSEDIVPDYYNFGNGEIGTAGRLIRYELKPGTYTLQGSNAADYLLYYMRVSKARPEMTDIVQPAASDYNLFWSGATYTNNAATGHLPIDDNKKHIVDENNLTHTVSLKPENNSLNTSLNLNLKTFTLAGIDLVVETTRVAFTSTDSNEYGSSTIYQYPETNNGSFDLQTYNAGNYALSGTINEPDYKYKAFYDKLHLDAVQYEVKSPIMPGLYTSMKGDAANLIPVDKFTSLDEAWAIGFLMPKVVPDLNVTPDNYSIGINIPDWTKSGDGDATGLGVIVGENGNYTLGNQDDMIHPREGWTYKIKWASIPDAKKIVPSLTGDKGDETKDTDHYFIYDGTIAKSVEIPTPYTEQQLDVTLNFRSASENLGNDATYNLNFGNDFYLTAEISPEDAQNYAGKMVRLKVDFTNTQGGGNDAIHWTNSRNKDDSTIEYGNSDGTELQFEIKQGQRSYVIHWQFVRDDGTNTTTQFTYTIGGQNVSGETSATVVLNGNGQAVDNPNELNLPLIINLNFYRKYPDGSTDNNYNNLIFGVSRVGLKATIYIQADHPEDYYGKFVYLQGTFSDTSGTGNAGIHWDNSRDSGNDFEIAYKSGADRNGTQLQFQIENGKTEYDIEWVFKGGSQYNSSVNDGDVGFTYAVSATNSNYTVNGSNVSLNIQREANIFQGEHSLSWEEDGRYDINEILPQGANVTIGLSGEGVFKFVDHYWRIIKLPNIEYTTYDNSGDLHLDVTKLTNGTIAFEVNEQIVMRSVDYDNNQQLKSEENLSGSLNGLIIQGANTLELNEITITAPSSAFNN